MKVHLRHRFSTSQELVLEQFSDGTFSVSYWTKEGLDEEGRPMWYSNNTQDFKSYNEALEVFRKRRDSDSPFSAFTIDWDGIHNDVHYGSGRDFS